MLNEAALQALASFQAASDAAPVLSLYLNVDPLQRTTDTYKLALRHLLDSVDGVVPKEDRARVERYVELEYDWQGRGLACFSCAAEDFWQAFPLRVPVDDQVFVGRRPYLKPLSDLLDTYTRYGVVLVDREGAHVFLFHLGELEDVAGVAGEDVKRHKQGGWAAARFQRHEEETAYRTLKEAAEMVSDIVRRGQCRYLILGGTDENVARFAEVLPKHVQPLVVGTMNVDITASPAEVGEKSLAVIHQANAARKQALVDQLVTTAAKGGPAALGLKDTLMAVYAGRAHHLVVDDEAMAEAYRCDHCGYVDVEAAEACPLCGSSLRKLPDAVDSMVRWALTQGIDLTVVSSKEQRVDAGFVGALLRY